MTPDRSTVRALGLLVVVSFVVVGFTQGWRAATIAAVLFAYCLSLLTVFLALARGSSPSILVRRRDLQVSLLIVLAGVALGLAWSSNLGLFLGLSGLWAGAGLVVGVVWRLSARRRRRVARR